MAYVGQAIIRGIWQKAKKETEFNIGVLHKSSLSAESSQWQSDGFLALQFGCLMISSGVTHLTTGSTIV